MDLVSVLNDAQNPGKSFEASNYLTDYAIVTKSLFTVVITINF